MTALIGVAFLEAARSYCEEGYIPHPLTLDDKGDPKRPIVSGWPTLKGDWQQLEALPWSDAKGIGLVLGAESGNTAVVDVDDVDMAAAVLKVCNRTRATRTMHDHAHVWFREEEPSSSTVVRVQWRGREIKVELKAGGTHVVVPPTPGYRHAGTREQQPVLVRSIASAWEEIAKRIGAVTIRPSSNGTAPKVEGSIPDGERNNTLTSFAGTMRRRGMSETAILDALRAENNERCNPPLPDEEVARIAASVMRYPPAAPAIQAAPSVEEAPPRGPLAFADLAAMEIVEHPTIVPGLIPQGSITLVPGRPDHGKSLLIHDLLVAHASGGLWLGQFNAGHGVSGLVDFEMPTNAVALRTKAQAAHRGLSDIPFFRWDGLPATLDTDDGAELLERLVQEHGITLLALDPLSDVLGAASENDATPIRQVFSRLISICRSTDVTILLVDHRRKQGLIRASALDEIRGSSVKVAKSDSILSVTRQGETTKLEHLRYKFGPKHAPFSFRLEPAGPDIVPVYAGEVEDGGAEALERAQGAILDALEQGPATRRLLSAQVQEATEVGQRTIDRALKALVDDGEITRGKDGRETRFALLGEPEAVLFAASEGGNE